MAAGEANSWDWGKFQDGSPWGFRAISGGDLAAGQFEMDD
jgi:hypothetical protein